MLIRALFAPIILGVVLPSPIGGSAEEGRPASSRAVQSAIVAAVEKDRRRFGGRTPIPATLIGVWDGNGGSFIRAFG
jgi:hypothetical protein